jgi:hypothetical protein
MRVIWTWIVAFVSGLCRMFIVTPDSLIRGKRGNLPPPSGGLGAY